MIEVQAPNQYILNTRSVFLAGSIEMGKAEKWQDLVIKHLRGWNITVFNPRRNDWDSSWEQKESNVQFRNQVLWELEAIDKADMVAFYFDPKTQSPISLLELGLCAQKKPTVVCCPEGFWRKGNVDIVCKKFGITQVKTLSELIRAIREVA
jgi:hypothetical protein